jgi:hypothetical protein
MPLTGKVDFVARVQNFNRVQIPKLVRWRHKIEPSQILKVTLSRPNASGSRGEFLAKMGIRVEI